MESERITVFLYKKETTLEIPKTNSTTAEEACKYICKQLQFRPVSLHLFGLKRRKGNWLPCCYNFERDKSYSLEFRLRFKIPSLNDLSKLDENAFDYTFHQMRYDLLKGHILEILNDETKSEALGLCITDMLRTMREEDVTQEHIEKHYKAFIPKSIFRQHFLFLKRRVHESLSKLSGSKTDVKYIKEQYVSQVEKLAPNYFTEKYIGMMVCKERYPVEIKVNPNDPQLPGLSIADIAKKSCKLNVGIQDLYFVTITTEDGPRVRISRKSGTPIELIFKSSDLVYSLVSSLDGYYRLTEKWTFNLCQKILCPTLEELYLLRCHGPVGEKFSHRKLRTNANESNFSRNAYYLLRQSSFEFDEYNLDVLMKNQDVPECYIIERLPLGSYKIQNQDDKLFNHLLDIVHRYVGTDCECVRPSAYDESPLLLCRHETTFDPLPDDQVEEKEMHSAPQIIPISKIIPLIGKKYEMSGKFCFTRKALWKPSPKVAMYVALKSLKVGNQDLMLRELLSIADRCAIWQCESLVGLRGVILSNPYTLVFDWMPLGPLDMYLRKYFSNDKIDEVHLISACYHLSQAVWFLEDKGIVHGNIRCHNVLVAEHSENNLLVKLSDPSVVRYSTYDVHWIPPELFDEDNLFNLKGTHSMDVWSLGTSMWEIFSIGKKPNIDLPPSEYKKRYARKWRLPIPEKCPKEIYSLIHDCWRELPQNRKQPQALVRDIHQILYQLIGSRHANHYCTVQNSSTESEQISINMHMNGGFDVSHDANWTTFSDTNQLIENLSDGTFSTSLQNSANSGSNHSINTESTWLIHNNSGSNSCYASTHHRHTLYLPPTLNSVQRIYELGEDDVTVERVIGEGFYGNVHMGKLLKRDGTVETVAIKMMKEKSGRPDERLDLQTESEILKRLVHPNIVVLKGIVTEPPLLLVMEYLPIGSLKDYFKTRRIESLAEQLKQSMHFSLDICKGMEYLHQENIVHRDLAARNILLGDNLVAKVSDFGLARITDEEGRYKFKSGLRLPIKWYPPESLKEEVFSKYSDVWSYGVTLYEIFSLGEEPNLPGIKTTDDQEEIVRQLENGRRLPCPKLCQHYNIIYNNLMCPCWDINPEHRPTFLELIGHIREIQLERNFQNILMANTMVVLK